MIIYILVFIPQLVISELIVNSLKSVTRENLLSDAKLLSTESTQSKDCEVEILTTQVFEVILSKNNTQKHINFTLGVKV